MLEGICPCLRGLCGKMLGNCLLKLRKSRATVENANVLKRKLLAKCASGESTRQPTDEEFMSAGLGEDGPSAPHSNTMKNPVQGPVSSA